MMRKKIMLLAAMALVLGVMQVNAQATFGLKAGLNVSNLTVKGEGIKVKYNSLPGLHIGVMASLPISDNLSIDPALLYSGKGAKGDDNDEYVALYSNESYNINYLELPINISYSFNLSSTDNIKPFVFAGPYLGLAFSGKYKSENTSEKFKIGNDKNTSDIKPVDYGANIGAGVKFSNFRISAQYGIGMANILPGTSSTKMHNSTFGLSIGYTFGGE
ncbi:MAG: porin family protein [Niabella sp.]